MYRENNSIEELLTLHTFLLPFHEKAGGKRKKPVNIKVHYLQFQYELRERERERE